jgi:hypothetical protein
MERGREGPWISPGVYYFSMDLTISVEVVEYSKTGFLFSSLLDLLSVIWLSYTESVKELKNIFSSVITCQVCLLKGR